MKNADSVLIDRKYDSPDWFGDGAPGEAIKWPDLRKGTMVQLECNGKDILANIVDISEGRITAKIIGFERYYEETLGGLERDQLIEFAEIKVHCMYR